MVCHHHEVIFAKATKKRYHASCHYLGRSLKRATVSTKPSASASTKSAISASTLPLTWKPVKPSLRQTQQQQYGALKIRAKKVRSSIWSGSATRLAQIQDDPVSGVATSRCSAPITGQL